MESRTISKTYSTKYSVSIENVISQFDAEINSYTAHGWVLYGRHHVTHIKISQNHYDLLFTQKIIRQS